MVVTASVVVLGVEVLATVVAAAAMVVTASVVVLGVEVAASVVASTVAPAVVADGPVVVAKYLIIKIK